MSLGIQEEYIRSGIEALETVPGRLERVSKPGEPAVFVDYAHTGDALEKVLENLSDFKEGRIITVSVRRRQRSYEEACYGENRDNTE